MKDRLAPVLLLAVILAGWEAGVRAGAVSALFFPAPSTIMVTLAGGGTDGGLVRAAGVTLARVLSGFIIGGLPGMVLGLFMGLFPRLRRLLDPFVAASHPIPKIAILPLVMIILGIGEASKVAVVAIAAFFPMLINTMTGVLQINSTYFDVAVNYGAGTMTILRRVVLPGCLPFVMAGARLALNIALLVTIAVELIAAREGLGSMIWFAWETLRTEDLYASLTVVAVLGIGFNHALRGVATILVPWKPPERAF
jgi:NitT/TauT family transport system permease protein